MKLTQVKEWILVISASVSMFLVGLGIWQTLAEYQLKLRPEEFSSQAETDIRLLKAFSEIVRHASGDIEERISEKTIELLFQKGFISDSDMSDPKKLNEKLEMLLSFVTQ